MIIVAAIKHKGIVFTGVRHCEILKDILTVCPNSGIPDKKHQGFINHNNEFLNRAEALSHAVECGQVRSPNDILESSLTSSDLW